MSSRQQFQFGSYRLDPGNALFWCDTKLVSLPPKLFDLLYYFLQHPDRLISKEELLDKVWSQRIISESTLKGSINDLRNALNDNSKTPRYIETIPRRGYRFIADVAAIPVPGEETAPASVLLSLPQSVACHRNNCWVGHSDLLERVNHHLYQQAVEGKRRITFITGEAGIGKTTFVEMFLAQIQLPHLVLRAQCIEHYGAGEAFLPILEALENACRQPDGAALMTRLRYFAPSWLIQMPVLVDLEERERLRREIGEASRERMLRELAVLLEELGRELLLVLVLDDLHWSDYATLDLLSLLGRRREHAALFIIGTYRPVDAVLLDHPVRAVKQDLLMHGLGTELPLDALSQGEVADYLRQRFAVRVIPAALTETVFSRTEGHPLFMVNLVDYLLAKGYLQKTGSELLLSSSETLLSELPEDVQVMIENQLARHEPDKQHLLAIASAVGMEWPAALLATVLAVDLVEVEHWCEFLVTQGLVLERKGITEWPDGTVTGLYGFRHALYVDTLYRHLTPAQQVQLHRGMGECLETAYGERVGEIAAELAMHFERGRDTRRTVKYLRLAAEKSAKRYANPEAKQYLTRALKLIDQLPLAEQAALRVELLRQRALVLRAMDNMLGAMDDFTDTLVIARHEQNLLAEVIALVDLARTTAWYDRWHSLDFAVEAMERSKDLPDEVFKLQIKAFHAFLHIIFQQWRKDYAELCDEALQAARQTGNPYILNMRLPLHVMLCSYRANYIEAIAFAEEAVPLAQSVGDQYQIMFARWYHIYALLHRGQWGEAESIIKEASLMAEKNGHSYGIIGYQLGTAWLHEMAQDHEGAYQHCKKLLLKINNKYHLGPLIICKILLGKTALALKEYHLAFSAYNDIQRMLDKNILIDTIYYFQLHLGMAEYWLALRDLPRARECVQALCELAAAPGEVTYLALGYRLQALIAMQEGNTVAARGHIEQALALLTTNKEIPIAAWRVYVTAADVAAVTGDLGAARDFLGRSMAVRRQLADSLPENDTLRHFILPVPMLEKSAASF